MAMEVPAHIEPPPNIVLRQSLVDNDRIGAFCKDELIPKGWEVGPFKGRIIYNKHSEEVDQKFSWEVYDLETFKFLHIVDATNSDDGNWMRYVCCARFFEEQNIVSSQNGTDVYYRALKDIQPGEELLTWFQPKKKRKRSSIRSSKELTDWVVSTEAVKDTGTTETELGTGKRKRKPKIIPDSYQGPLDFMCTKKVRKTDDDDEFEPLKPGQKRRRRKKINLVQEEHTNSTTVNTAAPVTKSTAPVTKLITPVTKSVAPGSKSITHDTKPKSTDDSELIVGSKIKSERPNEEMPVNKKESKRPTKLKRLQQKLITTKINDRLAKALREANKLVDWQFPPKGKEYVFKLKKHHLLSKVKGKKAFKCDICQGLYQQVFSLKRHYLRNHINYRYISKADIDNCAISLVHHQQMLYERSLLTDWRMTKQSEQYEEVNGSHSFFEKLDETVKPHENKESSRESDTVNGFVKQECSERSLADIQSVHSVEKLNVKQEVLDPYFDDVKFQCDDKNEKKPCFVESEAISAHSDKAEEMTAISSNKILKETDVETNRCEVVENLKNESSQEQISICKNGHNNVISMDTDQETNVEGHTNGNKVSEIRQEEDLGHEKTLINIKQENNILNTKDAVNGMSDLVNEDQSNGTKGHKGQSKETEVRDNAKGIKENMHYDAGKKNDATVTSVNNEKSSCEMPGLYRCFTCYTVYDTVQELKDHLDDHPASVRSLVCDKCNMRFRFKQNLRRHQKVHENEKPELVEKKKKKIWAKSMGDDRKIDARQKLKKQKTEEASKVTVKPATIVPKGTIKPTTVVPKGTVKPSIIVPKGTSDNLFKCNKCQTIFPNQTVLTNHVQKEHKDGGKFQCQYCGKDFPSMPNMKKHVRFHLGYRVRCRVCDEIFSNVGALRQHTRLVHPEIYKARRDKLTKSKETKAGVIANDKVVESKERKESAKSESKVDFEKSEELKESNKDTEDFLLGNDITFEAHEIDDGGSRFKFSCTVCKKRFSSYINMCRHRRKVHSSENKQKLEEGLIFTRKSKNSTPPVVEDRKELEQFYASVSHNIAINLNCFIDGKPESLENYTDHIIVDDYKGGSFGYCDNTDSDDKDIVWEQYNFPPNFKPVLTLPVCDQTVNENYSEVNIDTLAEEKTVNHSSIDNNLQTSDSVVDTENSTVEEIPKKACDIDKVEKSSCSDISTRSDNNFNSLEAESQLSDQSEVFDSVEADMGKSSTGIKTFASIGLNAVQKIAKSFENLTGDAQKKDIKDADVFLKNSPSLKNFCHVKNGEYANFDDLMLGDDFSMVARDNHGPSRSRALSSASSRQTKKKCRYRRSHSAGDLIDSDPALEDDCYKKSSEDLYKASQAEIDDLYNSLEMGIECDTPGKVNTRMECDIPRNVTTPKSLRKLCEKMLGLKANDRKTESVNELKDSRTITKSDDGSSLLSNLALSVNQKPEVIETGMVNLEPTPDYSDAALDSPFYNYETIAFGKNGDITKVCAVCKIHFADFDSLIHHHWKKHPSSACNFLEVEDGNDIESLHFAHPSTVGAIAVTDPGLDNSSEVDMFTCTRCGNTFKSKARLHVHILNCSPIDPVYGALKPSTSPVKSPVKKKMQQRFNDNVDQNKKQNPTFQKRIFTGCRKRTAVLLPDSPIKMMSGDKAVSDIISGYNPNKHIRRRELTELVDTLTCEACGLKFKTILLLERHVKNCAEKEKFKHVRPLTCPIMDESLAKIKNICFYCDKNFTYAKSLMNHFQDFCPVKKMKVDQDTLTAEDMLKEREIMDRLQKQEEDKVSKDKELDGQKKRSWQVGRKPKRKGHSWTYIKRRKQISALSENGQQGIEMEVEENFLTENDLNEISLNGSLKNSNDTHLAENKSINQIEENACEQPDANGNFVAANKSIKIENSSYDYDEVDSYSNIEEEIKDEGTNGSTKSIDKVENYETENEVETTGTIKASGLEKMDPTGIDEFLPEWDRDANTSLDFTTRYKVNHVQAPKKEVLKKPSIFQCVTSHDNINETVEATQTAERSKRKRERCGKVEAFLQNVFKRKKSKEAINQKISSENTVTENCKSSVHSKKASKKQVLEQDKRGRTYRAIAPKFSLDTRPALTMDDIRLPKIERPRFVRKEIDEKITTVSLIADIEVRREPSGNLRYLFKGGRRRKYPKVDKNTDLEDQPITVEDKDLQIAQSLPNLESINRAIPLIRGRQKKGPRDILPKVDFSQLQFQTYNLVDHIPEIESVQEKVICDDDHINALSALESTKPNLDSKYHASKTATPCNTEVEETQKETCSNNKILIENSDSCNLQKLDTVRNTDTNSSIETEVNKSSVLAKDSKTACHIDEPLSEKDVLPEMACQSKSAVSSSSVTKEKCPIYDIDTFETDNNTDIDINTSDFHRKRNKESTAKMELQYVEIIHFAEDEREKSMQSTVESEVCEPENAEVKCVHEHSQNDVGNIEVTANPEHKSGCSKSVVVVEHDQPSLVQSHNEQVNEISSDINKKATGVCGAKQCETLNEEGDEKQTTEISEQKNAEKESEKHLQSEYPLETESLKMEESGESCFNVYTPVILSPSERVKTNKRSCKKVPSPFTPVWVKQQKSRPKTAKVKDESESKVNQTVSDEKKQNVTVDVKNVENSSTALYSADLHLTKDIPKALKRKLEIVSRFDSRNKAMQKKK